MANLVPKGVSAAQFGEALGKMRAAVGTEWVFVSDSPVLRCYYDTYSPAPAQNTAPSAAVCPASVEEVQKVVVVANEHRIPLWSISTGKNYAYGGPAPREGGQVVLDLKRMNRILEVNTDFAYALVEPGVSYLQLYNHLKERNLKLWIDPASNALGGIVGNTLDHGVGYTPYGDHLIMQCGMEVVLTDGTLFRTGMGGLPGARTWQLFKFGFGPYVDGLFTQSNFGVVTKLGIWLMPEPPVVKPFMIAFAKEDDLPRVIEVVRPLKVNMVIPNAAFTVDLLWEAAVTENRSQHYSGAGPLPDSVRRKIASDLKLGMWNFYAGLYGLPKTVDATWKIVRDAFASIPGATFYGEDDREGDVSFEYRAKLMRGIPNMTEFGLLNFVGGGGHINFSPISPTTGEHAWKQYGMIRDTCHRYGFDYMGEFVVGWRDMHHIVMLMFDRQDAAQSQRAAECFGRLIDEAAAAGYGEYRTNLAYMDQLARTYNAFDGSLLTLQRRIKRALDPNGILALGKNGIWPLGADAEKKA
ncbi:MAG: FAD-binding oxidoreductase [Candidatus Binatia bacterium]